MVEDRSRFLQVMMGRLLVLPQLEFSRSARSAAAPGRQITVVALGRVLRRAEARTGGEEGDDSHADAHTECSSGRVVGAVRGVRDDLVVVVVVVVVVVARGVVEGGGRRDDEDVAETDHAHIRREAVVDAGAGGGGGPGGGATRERGSIEAEREVVGGGGAADGGGGGGRPVSECAGVREQPPGRRSHNYALTQYRYCIFFFWLLSCTVSSASSAVVFEKLNLFCRGWFRGRERIVGNERKWKVG